MIQYIELCAIVRDRREIVMRRYLGLAFALVIVTSLPAAAQDAPVKQKAPVPHHHATHPAKKRTAPAAENSLQGTFHRPFTPYPHTGDGDNDGLSRDPDDCNKGCIDGNPG
jgi:hypothetical protein